MDEKLPPSQQPLTSSSHSKSSIVDELFDLAASPNLDVMLRKAINMSTRMMGAQAGSILFKAQTIRQFRSGSFPEETLSRIQRWEEVISQRLKDTPWRIPAEKPLPVSLSTLPESRLVLVNVPLTSDTKVVGSLSLVLSPGYALGAARRSLLIRVAKGVGQMASLLANLEMAHQRLKQMGVFYKVSQTLMTTFDINKLLADTMKLAAEMVDAGAASLMLIDEDNRELVFEVSHGSRGHLLRQQRIPLDEGIAGWVARTGQPVVTNDARSDPRFSHRVDVRTGFLTQSIAAMPLKIKGRVIGVLEVLNKYSDAGFDQADMRLMSAIAAQAAIAIENARLYQRIRQERDHVIKAQEGVRRELNRRLHDGPVQLLSAISMSMEHLDRLYELKPEAVPEEMASIQSLVHQTLRDARNILFELRPLLLETHGLVAALEQYVDQLRKSESFTLHFAKPARLVEYEVEVAGTIFSIIQEAISNIKRHAEADNVWLALETRSGRFIVTVRDDGIGFDMNDRLRNRQVSFGMVNMHERAELIDAELLIDSRTEPPRRGTVVQLILALPA